MLLTLFIPFLLEYTPLSLGLALLCGCIAYFSKPYFFFGLPVLISYLFLFVSQKRSIIFGLCSMAFVGLVIVIMNHFFPSYFDDCFFVHLNSAAHYSMGIVLKRQLLSFTNLNLGVILLIALILIHKVISYFKVGEYKAIALPKGLDAPFFPFLMSLDAYAGICAGVVLIAFMGNHYGANLWYFFQLLSPFLIIMTAGLAAQFPFWPVVMTCFLVYNLFSLTSDDDHKYFDQKYAAGWPVIEKIIQSHDKILSSPLFAPLLIENNKEVFDDGHTEGFFWGAARPGLWSRFFGEDNRVNIAQAAYFDKLHGMIANKQFDLVLFEVDYSSPINVIPDNIKTFYKYLNSILVYVPEDRRPYLVTIWVPNQ